MSAVVERGTPRKTPRVSEKHADEQKAGLVPRQPSAGPRPSRPIARDASLRRAVRTRLSSILDALIVATCSEAIETRLHALQPAIRMSVIPQPAMREELADLIVAGLPRTMLIALLAPDVLSERNALMEFAGGEHPGPREAALDALGHVDRTDRLQRAVHEACMPLLEPRFALLGAASPSDPMEPIVSSASPAANEASILSALERGESDLVARILAAHAAVNLRLVQRAMEWLDSRPIIALAWRAGYSARTAFLLQTLLLGLSPKASLRHDDMGSSSTFRSEMAWQLALLAAD
ncbi:hypothetical protein NFI95_13605 [Acetobacteraceae bacterium KSS8]|uniref:DUF2336 domain-containing protein n=1 Tax=Endosaccharibacter trunci TaxID=2812733 RepID=A0ABT1W9B1_9PROT|nr:hypothetical protein [Acetobacteraceae bacterium KSS8]